jgi:hypothetical protein
MAAGMRAVNFRGGGRADICTRGNNCRRARVIGTSRWATTAREDFSLRIHIVVASLIAAVAAPALATEGGAGHYLLGSRDLVAGILPPPGTYVSADGVFLNANVDRLSIGGAVLANADTEVFITKLSFTQSFMGGFLGARWAITLTQPVVTGQMSFDSPAIAGRRVKDERTGLGDTTMTFGAGWDEGPTHVVVQTSFFLPLGYYQPAQIDIPGRQLEVLSFGKNRLGITPVVAVTHLDPKTGFELTGAAGISFSARNQATDYQTAPEFHFEGAIAQHFGPQLAAGLAGYAYAQLGEDSGSGAAQLKAALGAQSLKARVFGLGPVASYSTKIGGSSLTLKGKYTHEFGARRRFSGDLFQLTAAIGF